MSAHPRDEESVPKWKIGFARFLIKIESKLGSFRRRHLRIDPETTFFVSSVTRQSNRLLNRIFPNDTFYTRARFANISPAEAKRLFLYGYARQILKAGASIMVEQDLLVEDLKSIDLDTLGRAVVEAMIDRQNTLARKLIEILINLINFSNTNVDEAYRMYLSAENLDRFLGRQSDSKEFYGFTSHNTDSSIKLFRGRIRADLSKVNARPWFLKAEWETTKSSSVFSTARSSYKRALSLARDEERIVMGGSYFNFFSDLSGSVHPEAGARNEKHYSHKSIRDNIAMISLLSLHSISRINELLNFDDPDDISKVQKDGQSWGPALITHNFRRLFEKGDIVLAGNDLAEIVETKTSEYGYTSYKVKFISTPPLPEFPEDYLPSRMVISLLPKSQVRGFLLKYKDDPSALPALREVNDLMAQASDDVLLESAKRTFLRLFNDGLLFQILIQSGVIKKRDVDD